MQLLDRVLGWDDVQLWAQVSIREATPFLDTDQVHAVVGLEYLAQAAAAFFTVRATPQQEPHAGMLIASRRFAASCPSFTIGTDLLVRVKLESRLPSAEQRPGLVKFSGAISQLEQPFSGDTDPVELLMLTQPAIVEADLSVYL